MKNSKKFAKLRSHAESITRLYSPLGEKVFTYKINKISNVGLMVYLFYKNKRVNFILETKILAFPYLVAEGIVGDMIAEGILKISGVRWSTKIAF